MLLKFYHQSYRELLVKLLELEKLLMVEDTDMIAIKTTYEQGKAIFQAQILTVNLDELECSAISLLRSAQTEIYKNLRLLGTELLFLTSSRQMGTMETRRDRVQKKIRDLMGYCRVIIEQLER